MVTFPEAKPPIDELFIETLANKVCQSTAMVHTRRPLMRAASWCVGTPTVSNIKHTDAHRVYIRDNTVIHKTKSSQSQDNFMHADAAYFYVGHTHTQHVSNSCQHIRQPQICMTGKESLKRRNQLPPHTHTGGRVLQAGWGAESQGTGCK